MTEQQTREEEPARRKAAAGRVPYLYAVFDCMAPLAPGRHPLGGVDAVALGRGAVRGVSREGEAGARVLRLTFTDEWMSGTHARLERSGSTWTLRDQHSRNGVCVNGVLCAEAVLDDGDVFQLGRTFFVYRASQSRTTVDLVAGARAYTVVPQLEASWERLAALSRSRLPVHLHGPPGVGKEVAARELHTLSGRKGELVSINSATLVSELSSSLLQGYEEGSHSSATKPSKGLVRSADGGTLFLDEVGDLPLSIQPVLLRLLGERAVLPLGASRPVPVDFQLVTATNRDLPAMVAAGTFRADLWDRLRAVALELPPLEDRLEDLGLLVDRLARRDGEVPLTFEPEAAWALLAYPWRGNIRELEAALRYALALARRGPVARDHLPPEVTAEPGPPHLSEDEARLASSLVDSLSRNQGNTAAVARELGVYRMQIWRWLKRLKIDADDYRRLAPGRRGP